MTTVYFALVVGVENEIELCRHKNQFDTLLFLNLRLRHCFDGTVKLESKIEENTLNQMLSNPCHRR